MSSWLAKSVPFRSVRRRPHGRLRSWGVGGRASGRTDGTANFRTERTNALGNSFGNTLLNVLRMHVWEMELEVVREGGHALVVQSKPRSAGGLPRYSRDL